MTILVAAVLFGLSLFAAAGSAAECDQWVAKAASVQGPAEVRRAGQVQWVPFRFNDTCCPGDMVRVRESGRVELLLRNDTTLRLDQKTTVTFGVQEKERGIVAELLSGALHFFSRFPRSLKVTTPSVNAAVKGTEAFVRADNGETTVTVFEGEMLVDNEAGSVSVGAGQSAVALKGQPPVLRLVVRPRDAVQWTLYYPTVVSYCPQGLPAAGSESLQSAVGESVSRYCKGDIAGALEALPGPPSDITDPSVLVYRATLMLTVGRVQEARADLARAVSVKPSDGDALALQSMISLVLNEREDSLKLAQRAVESNPLSAPARISLSYALQAGFDLTGALEAARKATEIDQANSLAWARLAEVSQSLGYLDESLKAADKAASLYPELSRTQTMRGFASLVRTEPAEAEKAFETAMTLDQGDPLPRLGAGLAAVRAGRLEEGRRGIEIAAGLDPGNSLIRSYLGKAYYEEKRDDKAAKEFTAAKELDPLDPTPWFYDAIRKQSTNRPVEALHDLQKAISLNDNRGVYRSRLLLDSDLAARSADLGRIYANLGFQQLALVEGWKSVTTDPSNFSAHRFLADSYSTLPRHEIARVSELLQSQLLQPVNINPVQPRLGEPRAFIPSGAGPSMASFNEYNPLFYRDGMLFQASGIVGEQGTVGDEMALSGVKGRFSFSLGQFHYETDGFRPNNGLRQDIYDVYAQGLLSARTIVQAEFRAKDSNRGDRELRFDPEDFLPTLGQNVESRIGRIGLRHTFSPGSDLIASVAYQNLKESTNITSELAFGTTSVNAKIEQEGLIAEVQHLYRSGSVGLISGAGYFTADQSSTTDIQTTFSPEGPPLPPQTQSDRVDRDLRHTNLYVYSQINPVRTMTVIVGLSADFFEGSFIDRNQANPKVGIIWNPVASTTVRAAAFRVLTRSLINSQTLEPTQVAGFNQFFDDAEGTDSWRYGVALDQKFTGNLSAGLEYSQRDLKMPFRSFVITGPDSPPTAETIEVKWKERNGRAYLYWTPHNWLALSAEYFYEKFDRDREFSQGVEHVRTQRLPLGLNFYHPSGFSVLARATYVDQEGRFVPQGSALGEPGIPGSDSFWVFDASLGYRLPKRLGLIAVGASNLFDKRFRYQDMDPFNPTLQPKRLVFGKAIIYL